MSRAIEAARRRRALVLGLGGALLAHAVLLVAQDAESGANVRIGEIDARPAATTAPETDARTGDQPPIVTMLVALDAQDLARLPLVVVAGPGDDARWSDAHPDPGASADLPGETAADRGGGANGGAATWTGRRDPDQTALRAQLWNGASVYRIPRADDARRAATSEAIARAPDATYGDRTPRDRARGGAPDASRGAQPDGTGAGNGATAWRDADPVFDAAAGTTTPRRKDGATRSADEAPLADRGATAVDTPTHGATGDDVAAAAASNQRDPDPYDLTPSRAGGSSGEGVRGATPADGAIADGRGHGTGATRAHVAAGRGGVSVVASRTDPYLRELLRRLDATVIFPHDLELDLRSGRVIATMVVRADGAVSDITVSTSSGFPGFDRELTRALGAIAPLRPVPTSLLSGARAVRVVVPYTFSNPMIQ